MAIAVLAFFVLVGTWMAVGSATRTVTLDADRERRTGAALRAAKEAVLAYAAAAAASTLELSPGRLPCPEVRSQVGTANEGYAGPFAGIPCDNIGRLPWRTLGIDQLRDGHGEPLWYAVATGTWAWVNVNDVLAINPGTPDSLAYDGLPNAVVAVIIAPGPPIAKTGAPPSGCSVLSQHAANRNTSLSVANFLECGNATGNYRPAPLGVEANVPAGELPWNNDRALAITAREVIDAVSGAVADRMQRQVAPALSEWRTTTSAAQWGRSFLPYASSFDSDPATNDLCGNANTTEGVAPFASSAAGCVAWTSGSVNAVLGVLTFPTCSPTAAGIRCTFTGLGAGFFGMFRVNITVTGANVGLGFRDTITAADISVNPPAAVSNFSSSVDASGVATTTFRLSTSFLWVAGNYTVDIENPPDAALLSDTRVKWFLDNGWHRYTYYAISPAVSVAPGTTTCPGAGGADCLTLSGLPSANGLADDKQLVLALTGNAVTTAGGYVQAQPSTSPLDYLESHATGTAIFEMSTVNGSFNDRFAACPFRHTRDGGSTLTLC